MSLALAGGCFTSDPPGTELQFCSVTQSHPTLATPWTDCNTPGFSVHQLPELAQTNVHQVGDAIQPSLLLSSPSPPAFNFSHNQGLFQSVSSSHQVAKVLQLQLQHQSFQWNIQFWFPLGWTGWISLQSKGLSRVFSSSTVQKHQFFGCLKLKKHLSGGVMDCVPSSFICWSPKPPHFRWGLCRHNWGYMRSCGWTLTQYEWCPCKKGTDRHRGKLWEDREWRQHHLPGKARGLRGHWLLEPCCGSPSRLIQEGEITAVFYALLGSRMKFCTFYKHKQEEEEEEGNESNYIHWALGLSQNMAHV